MRKLHAIQALSLRLVRTKSQSGHDTEHHALMIAVIALIGSALPLTARLGRRRRIRTSRTGFLMLHR